MSKHSGLLPVSLYINGRQRSEGKDMWQSMLVFSVLRYNAVENLSVKQEKLFDNQQEDICCLN